MVKIKYFTEEGLKKLKDELHQLKTKGRAEIAKQIAEARDKGDLSENDKEKPQRSKKRKDPPKGGSFGPTVGGF